MIVRISGEDQYRLADGDGRISQLDDDVIKAVEADDHAAFASSYEALLEYVRGNGVPVGEDELEPSDLILPPADLTLAEARVEFTGEGLIPD
jgi:PspA-Associated protein